MAYVPLWCKSNYSFLEGASHPEELVERAHALGIPALALTDRDGVYGAVCAHRRARELGVRLVLGAQVSVDDGSRILLLAADRGGWTHLCQLLTRGRLRRPRGENRRPRGESRVSWREVCEHAGGLLALWGGEGSLLAAEEVPPGLAGEVREAFGDRLYALVARHRRAAEVVVEERLRRRARRLGVRTVAAAEILYHTRSRRDLQDVVTCVRHRVDLAHAGRRTRPNGEHALAPRREFAGLFADDPAAVARTREVAARAAFSLDELSAALPAVDWRPLDLGPGLPDRREAAIRAVYGRYGRDRAALAANVLCYRSRSAVRDVGRVLGLSEAAVDRLAKRLYTSGRIESQTLSRVGLDPRHPANVHLLRLAEEIQDFPRILSTHSGGFLLGRRPLSDLVPIETAAKGRSAVQWERQDLNDLGLFEAHVASLRLRPRRCRPRRCQLMGATGGLPVAPRSWTRTNRPTRRETMSTQEPSRAALRDLERIADRRAEIEAPRGPAGKLSRRRSPSDPR